ncbi:MAG: nucleotide-binding protein [candidate division WOR-3 bacterium]|nr:nucleotide-binding protein [candidate division WOR-3 bacterium]
MNKVEELKLHIDALAGVIEQKPSFFAPIIHYVKELKVFLRSSKEDVSSQKLKLLAKKIDEFYAGQLGYTDESVIFADQLISDSESMVKDINALVGELTSMDENSFKKLFPEKQSKISVAPSDGGLPKRSPCIFIGHGRSKLWARLKIYLEDELGLATMTYESESRVGKSIVPILEEMLDKTTFAVLVLTAEDETAEGSRRARQNVIHEAGLFQGRLGFKRAVILRQEGLEGFTNVEGLQYISFDGEQIEQAFNELERVLKREGMLK